MGERKEHPLGPLIKGLKAATRSKVQNAVLMWTLESGERTIKATDVLTVFLATNAARRLAMVDKCVSLKTFKDDGSNKFHDNGKPAISKSFLYTAAGAGTLGWGGVIKRKTERERYKERERKIEIEI